MRTQNGDDNQGEVAVRSSEVGVSRRHFLKSAGVAGATIGVGAGLGGLLAACGGETEATTASSTAATSAPSGTEGETTVVSAAVETGSKVPIGYVLPITGGLSAHGVTLDYCLGRWKEYLGDGLVLGDGKKHPISIEVADCQSDVNRAAQVAGDLINNTKVSLMMTTAGPEVVLPVVEQCEAFGCPVVSATTPWQVYLGQHTEYKWSYHITFGVEDLMAVVVDTYSKAGSNKVLGLMLDNTADGLAFSELQPPFMRDKGFTVVLPDLYQPGTEDFTVQISQFKKAGVELIGGVMFPDDFTNFWKAASQQGLSGIKAALILKCLLFPDTVEAIGPMASGLLTDMWWHSSYPFKSSLTGETCQQLSDDFEAKSGRQQTAALLHYCVGEMAFNALKNTKDPMSRDSVLAAVETLKVETIAGKIDFTEPIMPKTGPGPLDYKPGPGRKTKNVYGIGECVGQWVAQGGKWPFDIVLVDKASAPFLPDSVIKPISPLAAMQG